MSAYLLTFNPDIYSNNEDKTLIYAVGDKDTWACYSQQPKLGDTVYLMRLGVNPKGIIAKGTITKESFSKEHWSDASKQITVIEFVVDDFRPNCEQGLLPLMLLNLAIENYNWCPQRSGLVIDPVSHEQLVSLWNDSQSKHSLTQYLSWYIANEHDTEDWYRAYKETCQQVADIKQGRAITEADLKKIWSDSSNGIAGVGQGVMSESDFNKNINFLRQETAAIISLPTEQTYENTIKGWKNKAKFDRCLWSVINRAFAAAAPETYTSVVYDVYFQKILNTLKEQYQIDVLKAGSWLTQNKALLHKISRLIPADMDIYQRNIALWSLHNNNVTGSKGELIESDQVAESGKEYPVVVIKSAEAPINKIFYGPPGTGKTYRLQQLFKRYTSDMQTLTHEAFLAEEIASLTWMQVIVLCMLDLGGKAKVSQLVDHPYYQTKAKLNGRETNLAQTAWSALQSYTVEESTTVNYKGRSEPAVFDKDSDSTWRLVDAKKELIEDLILLQQVLKKGPQSEKQLKRYVSVTFHQSYGYEEFIEGLRAQTDESGGLSYSVEPGAFVKLCRLAEQDTENQYAIFIDEINRGNISKIFGELITLIEPDKRNGAENPISINLAYSGKPFSVPINVDIIGTMNTADRSLALIDTALRRRFEFLEMMPNYSELDAEVKGIHLGRLLEMMNERIEILYDREHTLGYAFFIPIKKIIKAGDEDAAFVELQKVFKSKVLPLLQEYFFEDWQKIRLVLGDNQREEALQFISEQELSNDALAQLFGSENGLNRFGDMPKRYYLKTNDDDVWVTPKAYQSIYIQSTAEEKI